jgi:hypothetical protein
MCSAATVCAGGKLCCILRYLCYFFRRWQDCSNWAAATASLAGLAAKQRIPVHDILARMHSTKLGAVILLRSSEPYCQLQRSFHIALITV